MHFIGQPNDCYDYFILFYFSCLNCICVFVMRTKKNEEFEKHFCRHCERKWFFHCVLIPSFHVEIETLIVLFAILSSFFFFKKKKKQKWNWQCKMGE